MGEWGSDSRDSTTGPRYRGVDTGTKTHPLYSSQKTNNNSFNAGQVFPVQLHRNPIYELKGTLEFFNYFLYSEIMSK